METESKSVIDFLKKVVVADTITLQRIFFKNASLRTCQARLKMLVDNMSH